MASRARQISLKECYDILRLEKGATLQDVKRAYRQRAFDLHPDLNPDNLEAGREFQLLNEAYVALSAMLRPVEEARQKAQAKKEGEKRQEPESEKKEAGENREEEDKTRAHAQKDAERASAAYAEQDVLRDLLNDPFARRVFEDIYSELNRKREPTGKARPAPPPPGARKKIEPPAKTPKKQKSFQLWERGQEKGVKGVVKDWLRRQIDEEQTLALPAARLAPGRKVRLQIRRGISDEVSSIEVTLPADFAVGKPVRLRGLGKRVGPWQGDLYLTINTR